MTDLSAARGAMTAMSLHVNASLAGRSDEAINLHRVMKVSEEAGEASAALIGMLGANPRKGVTHDVGDVLVELLDVACAALGAFEHLDGHSGRSLDELFARSIFVARRLGAID